MQDKFKKVLENTKRELKEMKEFYATHPEEFNYLKKGLVSMVLLYASGYMMGAGVTERKNNVTTCQALLFEDNALEVVVGKRNGKKRLFKGYPYVVDEQEQK